MKISEIAITFFKLYILNSGKSSRAPPTLKKHVSLTKRITKNILRRQNKLTIEMTFILLFLVTHFPCRKKKNQTNRKRKMKQPLISEMTAARNICHNITFHTPVQRISKQRSNGNSAACSKDQLCENTLQRAQLHTLKLATFLTRYHLQNCPLNVFQMSESKKRLLAK